MKISLNDREESHFTILSSDEELFIQDEEDREESHFTILSSAPSGASGWQPDREESHFTILSSMHRLSCQLLVIEKNHILQYYQADCLVRTQQRPIEKNHILQYYQARRRRHDAKRR